MYSSEWDVLSVCQTRTPSPHKGFSPPFIALWSNPTCHCGKITMRQRGAGGAGGQRREEDGGKMRGVNREGVSERRRERWEALNLPSRVQRGRKYPRKRMSMCVYVWVGVCMCERERARLWVFMHLCVCECVCVCLTREKRQLIWMSDTGKRGVQGGRNEARRDEKNEYGLLGWRFYYFLPVSLISLSQCYRLVRVCVCLCVPVCVFEVRKRKYRSATERLYLLMWCVDVL